MNAMWYVVNHRNHYISGPHDDQSAAETALADANANHAAFYESHGWKMPVSNYRIEAHREKSGRE